MYFLGAVGMINSLRLQGHREPVYVLDCGLSAEEREMLEPATTVVEAPAGNEPFELKTYAPRRHPAELMVLIDADIVVTRSLDPLLEQARGGRVVAFENPVDRFVPEWGDLLDLGPLRRRPYLCSGLVAMDGGVGSEVLALMEDRQRRVRYERSYFGARDHGYALMFADQDVLNAILASRVSASAVIGLDADLAPMPPFDGLTVTDEHRLRCAYRDGTEPYVVHQSLPWKPWLHATYDGVYSRLLRRSLTGPGLAIDVPHDRIPVTLRYGARAFAERQRVKLAQQLRWRLGGLFRRAAISASERDEAV
jgi:hypothetical protein